MCADVPNVYVHSNTPEQRALARVSIGEMERYAAEGHFKAGSMGPKVQACLRFARGGGEAIIGSLTQVARDVRGEAGTHIVLDRGHPLAPESRWAVPQRRRLEKGLSMPSPLLSTASTC